jgi:hypothetical protein
MPAAESLRDEIALAGLFDREAKGLEGPEDEARS